MKIIDPLNGTAKPTTFTYNPSGKRTSKTDARGNTGTYTWNGGDLASETDPEGFSVSYQYNTLRLMTSRTDARGKVTTMTYDSHGQLATENRPDGSKTTLTRDTWGRVKEERTGGASLDNVIDHITVTTYDDLGRVKDVRVRMATDSSVDSAADLVSSKTWDRDGNVKTETDPMGSVTTTTTDRRARVIAIDYPIGNGGSDNTQRPCQAFEYDQIGNQIKSRTARTRTAAATCSFSSAGISWNEAERVYDARNLKTEEKVVNLLLSEYSGGVISRSWQYDAGGRNTRITDPLGNYVEMTHDALGRKKTAEAAVRLTGISGPGCHGIASAVCSTQKWDYDEVGNVLTERIPRGTGSTQSEETRTYTYDKVQQLKTRTNELGKTWSTTYDGNGNKLSETDPLLHATTWGYDELNRVLSQVDALGNTTNYTYNKFGNRVTLNDPNGNITTYGYDKNNRLITVVDPPGGTSTFQYDKNGNRTSLNDPRGKVQSATYDNLSRLLSETTPNATATHSCSPTCITDEVPRTATLSYTLDGLKASGTDFNGLTLTSTYDSARRVKTLDYSDATPDVGYTWDKNGNRLTMSENGVTTATYVYDELNRLLTETRGAQVLTHKYDRRDNISVVYPDNKTIGPLFDAAGRLQTVNDWRATGNSTTFTYDDANRKTGQTLPSGAVSSWQYDNANRLNQVEHKPSSAGAAFARFNWTYDKAGNRLTQSDFDGSTTTTQQFEYDKAHRLVRETPRAGVTPTAYQYDGAGNRLRSSDGQALTENDNPALIYSATPTTVVNASASGGSYATISLNQYVDFSFVGDALSFIWGTREDAGTMRLTLDPGPNQIVLADINQCSSIATYQNQRTFTGFANGAHVLRVTMISGCPSNPGNEHAIVDAVRAYSAGKQHLFDDDNRLKQTTEGANTTAYQYDKNGSLTRKTLGADTTVYTYDGGRRLKDVSLNGTSQASFSYDGNGARTSKTSATGTTAYVNDTRSMTQVLQETKGATTLTYVPGVLQHDSSQTGNAQWSYFHQDAQNNRALTDNAASVSKRWEYEPFGSIRTQSGTANSDFQYAGEQRDPETGLINLRARYYDPTIGRFVSRDALSGRPGFPQSYNRYSYAFNNPLRFIDPSGYEGEEQSDEEKADEERDRVNAERAAREERCDGCTPAEKVKWIQDKYGARPLDSSNNYGDLPHENLQDFTEPELDALIRALNNMAARISQDTGFDMATSRIVFKELIGVTVGGEPTGRMVNIARCACDMVQMPFSTVQAPAVVMPEPLRQAVVSGVITDPEALLNSLNGQPYDVTITLGGRFFKDAIESVAQMNYAIAHEYGHAMDFMGGFHWAPNANTGGIDIWGAYSRKYVDQFGYGRTRRDAQTTEVFSEAFATYFAGRNVQHFYGAPSVFAENYMFSQVKRARDQMGGGM